MNAMTSLTMRRVGRAAGDAGDYETAIAFLTAAITAKPEYEVAYVYRALAGIESRMNWALWRTRPWPWSVLKRLVGGLQ